jgi:NADH dehydrogenase/NADH:ubiquinone oxidoreductase subunit G
VEKHIRSGLGALALVVALMVSASAFGATSTPTITSFAPLTAKAGATVTITGKNLTGATAVDFDGLKAASFKVASATKITAKLPSKAKSGKISVTTKAGTAKSSSSLKV